MVHHNFLKDLGKEVSIECCQYFFVLSLFGFGSSIEGRKGEDIKSKGKEPSLSDKLTGNFIDVFRMSIQYFTKPVGTESKSDDLHEASKTRWYTSSAVTQVRFCKTFRYQHSVHASVSQKARKTE